MLELIVAASRDGCKWGSIDFLGVLKTAVPKVETDDSSATGTKFIGTGDALGTHTLDAAGTGTDVYLP